MNRFSSFERFLRLLRGILIVIPLTLTSRAADLQMGDVDGDGAVTILDVVRIVALARTGALGASPQTIALADVNQDGLVNDTDAALTAAAVAGRTTLPALPLATVRTTSPEFGADGVSVTRETVFYLTLPLADSAVVNVSRVHATFGARQILSRVELASDHRTVTLFYMEPLPGSASIHVTFDGTGLTDFLGRPVDLDGDGNAGGTAVVDFETLSLTAVANTVASGRVFASEIKRAPNSSTNEVINTPLAGVTITVDGMEESLRTVTDAAGNFRLNPAPAGAFFVHIDGRTVTNVASGIRYPDLAYYPFVGKRWVTLAGQEINIGDIYLPKVAAGTLQTITAGAPTQVIFPSAVLAANPSLAGVALQVPADSLFSENGVRGGKVGIAPVSPDRLPGPLPTGVNPGVVITVQTDGPSNFDKPVPACFPNLPDPTTGQKLPPGSKSALWSFNHDTGRFEVVGPMTVSDDGTTVCTDPGVGILAPGWHFTSPGTVARGGGTGCDESGPTAQQEPGTQSRPPATPNKGPCPPGQNRAGSAGDPVQLFSGEMIEESTDLLIPGRGIDFRWQRTYRSKTGPNTEQGNGWDHPYNIRLITAGGDLVLLDGNGRGDRYKLGPGGTWTRPEFFRVIVRQTDGSLNLIFEDQGKWGFYPVDGSARGGRISFSQDRNGNQMSFAYDDRGRLSVITDTLGRNISIAYNSEGFIQSVTDFTARSVRYEYYKSGDSGGGAGDLRSVTSPTVKNTPTGNDFPSGKTVSYTYSTGFADERLNHNLLTVTDGRRNDPSDPTYGSGPYLINVYSTVTDPADPNFDRVIRQVWGGGVIDFVYDRLLPAEPNGYAVTRTIVNDRVGNVSEQYFDARNRLVRTRQYTGRAVSDQPTTALDNRPKNPLRPTDPLFFETIYEWTDDSLERRIIRPNGNITEFVYEADLNPNAPARTRGNRRIVRHLPGTHLPAGDQEVIEERYEYDADFAACCGSNFVIRETDGRGNVTRHEYDTRGNRTRTRAPVDGVVDEWEYNPFGQMVAHTLPDNGSGSRRRDEWHYAESGPLKGYLSEQVVDATHLHLVRSFGRDAVGNITRITDPNGNVVLRTVNELNQVVRIISPETLPGSGIRYANDLHYDANNNLTSTVAPNQDERGVALGKATLVTRYEYDSLNYPIRTFREIDETSVAITEYGYDGNRNRILERRPEAVAGRQPFDLDQIVFDERDLPFKIIKASGDPAQATRQNDYDANGNLVRQSDGIESVAQTKLFEYDGFDRLTTQTDAMGNRQRQQFDATGNIVHFWVEGELQDIPGSAGNIRLFESTRVFDPLNRPIQESTAHFTVSDGQPVGAGQATARRSYTAASQVDTYTDANNHPLRFTYDTANRPSTATNARGDSVTQIYDASGNLVESVGNEKSDLGGPDRTYRIQRLMDGLDRLIRTTDNAGNIVDYHYDSRGNRISVSDSNRATATSAGNQSRFRFDGLNRLIGVIHELTETGNGGGSVSGQIELKSEWDSDSRLVAETDGRGNVTRYEYDSLGRRIRTVYASGVVSSIAYDAHGHALVIRDPNGTETRQQFDALDRVIRKDISLGLGVATDTTFETWTYDGLSRAVAASNDAAQIALGFDSLGNLVSDSIGEKVARQIHDPMGNPIQTSYPGGRRIAAQFDSLDQLKLLEDVTDAKRWTIASVDYEGTGRLGRLRFGNGTVSTLAYDELKRVIRSTHSLASGSVFDDREFSWDPNSNKQSDRDRLAGGAAQVYRYDSLNRIRDVTLPDGSVRTYHFDSAGNRESVSGGTDQGAYSLGIAGSSESAMNQYTSTPFDQRAYDKNGNILRSTTPQNSRDFAFDYLDRLVRQTINGVVYRYQYDPLGRRIAKVSGATPAGTTRYYYHGLQQLEEQDGSGATKSTFVFGSRINQVISYQRESVNYWLHPDDLLSTRRVTDSAGLVVETYAYDEFGTPSISDASGRILADSAVANPWLFTGYRYDSETGFYFALNRYYDPRAGRFISRDPAGSWYDPYAIGNAFAYVGNNPATLMDPLGLAAKSFGVDPSDVVAWGSKAGSAAAGQASKDALAAAGKIADAFEGDVTKMFDRLVASGMNGEEAAAAVNSAYSKGLRGSIFKSVQDRVGFLERKAGGLDKLGKGLAAFGAAYKSWDTHSKNCDDTVLSVNDAASAGVTAYLITAAGATVPLLPVADAISGGVVTQVVGNGVRAPGTLITLATSRINGRDADLIKKTATETWSGKALWAVGDAAANTSVGNYATDKIASLGLWVGSFFGGSSK